MPNYTIANAASLMGSLDALYTSSKQLGLQLFTQNPGPADPTYTSLVSEVSGSTPQLQSLVSQYALMASILLPSASYITLPVSLTSGTVNCTPGTSPLTLFSENVPIGTRTYVPSTSPLEPITQTLISGITTFSGSATTMAVNATTFVLTVTPAVNPMTLGIKVGSSVSFAGMVGQTGSLANNTFYNVVSVSATNFTIQLASIATSPTSGTVALSVGAYMTITGTVCTVATPFNPASLGISNSTPLMFSGMTAPAGTQTYFATNNNIIPTVNVNNFTFTVANGTASPTAGVVNVLVSPFFVSGSNMIITPRTSPASLGIGVGSQINISNVSNPATATGLNNNFSVSGTPTSTSFTVSLTGTGVTAAPYPSTSTSQVTLSAGMLSFNSGGTIGTVNLGESPANLGILTSGAGSPNIIFSGITAPAATATALNGVAFQVATITATGFTFTAPSITAAPTAGTITMTVNPFVISGTTCTLYLPNLSDATQIQQNPQSSITISGITAPATALALNGTFQATPATGSVTFTVPGGTTAPTTGAINVMGGSSFSLVGSALTITTLSSPASLGIVNGSRVSFSGITTPTATATAMNNVFFNVIEAPTATSFKISVGGITSAPTAGNIMLAVTPFTMLSGTLMRIVPAATTAALGLTAQSTVTLTGITAPAATAAALNGVPLQVTTPYSDISITVNLPSSGLLAPTAGNILMLAGNISVTGGICTITPPTSPLQMGMYAGASVSISGVTDPVGAMALNGTFPATNVTSTSFSFSTTATSTPTAGNISFQLAGSPNNSLISYIPYQVYLQGNGTSLVTATFLPGTFPAGVSSGLNAGDQIIISNSTLTAANTPTTTSPFYYTIVTMTGTGFTYNAATVVPSQPDNTGGASVQRIA